MTVSKFASVRSTPAEIPSFVAMDMMRRANLLAAEGRSVIHLETGQPSTPAPGPVRAAAAAALESATLGYTEALGILPLRRRIAELYAARHGLPLDPERVVLTTGSSAGLTLAFLTLMGPGGRIGMARPSYPCYRNIALALGMEPVEIATDPAQGFRLTARSLDALDRPLDALLIASPANPTGVVLDAVGLAEIARWCKDQGVALIADEIYHGIVYGPPAATALGVDADAFVLNGFSKYYSMTGWRLGWMVAPSASLRRLECLAQNLYIAPPSLSQLAALAAFEADDELKANVARYAANRALLLDALPRIGFRVPAPPDGAFYLYAGIPEGEADSTAFAHRLLAETGVAVTPGVDFDRVDGGQYVRISYAGAPDAIAQAIGRLSDWRRVGSPGAPPASTF
jgi:aspartate/methionine/tyrosine aminotransferase